MLCAFAFSIIVGYFMHAHHVLSLSPSTLVGRFDGRGLPSAHSLFPSSFSPNRECCMYNRSVSAPPCNVLFLFLICHYPHLLQQRNCSRKLSSLYTTNEVRPANCFNFLHRRCSWYVYWDFTL
jgi:hypothetical protein